MATHHNRRFALAQRRARITKFYLQGWPQSAIASELGISQSTVSEDVRYVRRQWERSAIRNFDELRTRELQKLDYVEREAWSAWERSQKPAQAATVSGEGNGQQTRKSVKNQVGDPRYLDQIAKCIVQRRAITGLDAPLQVADATPPPAETPEERRAKLQQIFATIAEAVQAPQRRLLPPGK